MIHGDPAFYVLAGAGALGALAHSVVRRSQPTRSRQTLRHMLYGFAAGALWQVILPWLGIDLGAQTVRVNAVLVFLLGLAGADFLAERGEGILRQALARLADRVDRLLGRRPDDDEPKP